MEEVNLMVMIEVMPGKRQNQIDGYNKLKPLYTRALGIRGKDNVRSNNYQSKSEDMPEFR